MSWDDPGVYEACARVLRAGGVVLHPTETCYGLAVDVFNEEALVKLYALKGMGRDKPVSVLVNDLAMAKRFGDFPVRAEKLALMYWPGPLSLVVKRRRFEEGGLPEFVNVAEAFVSLRCSDVEFCSRMVGEFGGPVSTTSANYTGEPQAYEVEDLSQEFLEGVDLIVDGGRLEENAPSTILRVDGERIEVLRQGGLFICLENEEGMW